MVLTFVKRSAPPLHLESIETLPEDVLCPGSEEKDFADEDKRGKKRLRIEILGRQYLEGRPLFIQTAGLRGSFEKGWVNPWASKKRKYGVDDIRRFPEAPAATADRPRTPIDAAEEPTTAKRRYTARVGSALPSDGLKQEAAVFTRVLGQDEPMAKRTKHIQSEETGNHHDAQMQANTNIDAPGGRQQHWLKTDKPPLRPDFRDQTICSTPTPAAKNRAESAATSPEQVARPVLAKANVQTYDAQTSGFTPVNIVSAMRKDKPRRRVVVSPKRRIIHGSVSPAQGSGIFVAERNFATVDDTTRQGYEEVKRLSQEAARRAESDHGYQSARKLSQEAASRAYQTALTPSRLAPYVSEALLGKDAASSAGLKAASKAPRPSPHAVPPSTNLPEFKYRYARKRSSTSSSREGALLVEAPKVIQPRARSESSSSSGSSAFAEALEAAQAKAASGASSYSSSPPVVASHETTSVKKNTTAMRRLTFTSSGTAKLAGSRGSSRPSSSSSAVDPPAPSTRSKMKKAKASIEPEPALEISSKSSQLLSQNGKSTRSSVLLPEAQVVPDVPIQLAQVTSGLSTNLLETDKQPAKFPSLDDGDSYFDLSTQAAALKAQRSFKDEVLLGLTDSPDLTRIEGTSPTSVRNTRSDVTPLANNAPRRDRGSRSGRVIKYEDSDEEEPMSTQAMVDAMSPFAITTVKKKPSVLTKRASFVSSPTKKKSPIPTPALSPDSPTVAPFPKHSLSMSTSPSPSSPKPSPPIPLSHPATTSKPPSSRTSFSILPNGTLTETSIYQDGQRPQEDFDPSLPLDPFGTAFSTNRNINPPLGSPDLNAAIEDAGSFLGDWDVETEARKEGSSSRKRETGPKGILSVGRGSG